VAGYDGRPVQDTGKEPSTMNWKPLIGAGLEEAYRTTLGLVDMVEPSDLSWTPTTGDNWMTTAQLLMHLTGACGAGFKGVVTGDWGMPDGVDLSDMDPADMLPPADKMPFVDTVDQAHEGIEADRKLALEMLAGLSEDDLANKPAPVPWDPEVVPLGRRLLQMVNHLQTHKNQLFYYLKLQGKAVNTMHLYGM
jgi:hypothetical protein